MSELGWKAAIERVLEGSDDPMHYSEIAEAIEKQGLRKNLGATPPTSVNSTISVSLQKDGKKSPFTRVGRGFYSARGTSTPPMRESVSPSIDTKDDGLIQAFGMYWSRSNVDWTSNDQELLGKAQSGSTPVNFWEQRGVYMLHDGRAVVYVGRSSDRGLGTRLKEHIGDRLNGRWSRFSWFGLNGVAATGELIEQIEPKIDSNSLIATMEALLIEGLEPPQNRKRGDGFRAVEFIQDVSPKVLKREVMAKLAESLPS